MNNDIRLQMSFYSNTKVKKLRSIMGADAVLSLVYLWLYTAENRPHGELRGMDEADIALAAQWNGNAMDFVQGLKSLSFLDKKGKLYVVHDWENNNPWAANAPERKRKAQEAAKAKWAKKWDKKACYEQNLADASLCYEQNLADAPNLSFPSPSLPKEESLLSPDGDKPSVTKIPYHEILAAFHKFCPSFSKAMDLTDARKNAIRMRWLKYEKNPGGPLKVFDTLFKKAEASDFLTGRDGKWPGKRGIDWLLKLANMVKVLEGNFDNSGPQTTEKAPEAYGAVSSLESVRLRKAMEDYGK